MNLFDKCREFSRWIDSLKSRREYFYLREFDPPASPVVAMGGKSLIMLGSNNYLGLANHPKVVEATIKAVVETTEGARLQVSFGDETALIYPWQIVMEARCSSGLPQLLKNGAFDGRREI
jgi:7-keto-8-aminopelargonate synthetase-like enzyme